MLESGGGVIVNFSSTYGNGTNPENAINLGKCHRHRAYLMLLFKFMMGGRWVRGSTWDVCTGSYVT